MNRSVLIVAGGQGKRMGGDVPKQFMLLDGKPILVRTIDKFIETLHEESKIVVVLPREYFAIWEKFCSHYPYLKRVIVSEGGRSRFHSVKKGLKHISLAGVVAIHDGVRPLVSSKLISQAYKMAETHKSAIPAIEMIDSIRCLKNGELQVFDRTQLRAIQTPQVFNNKLIQEAYATVQDSKFITDDTMVFERVGNTAYFFEGERSNIKITPPFDLLLAEAIIKSSKD